MEWNELNVKLLDSKINFEKKTETRKYCFSHKQNTSDIFIPFSYFTLNTADER